MHAQARRRSRRPEARPPKPACSERADVLRAGCLEVDLATRLAKRSGRPLALTPRQFDLLLFLVRHFDEVVTRADIAKAVWQDPTTNWTNVIVVAIHEIRKQLESLGEPTMLHTVRGRGYRLGERTDL